MSQKQEVQNAVQAAKKDLEKEQKEALTKKVKAIVKETLERIDKENVKVKKHQDNVSILKKDLKDLESGRLDLIEDRQRKNPDALKITVIIVKKIKIVDRIISKPWYQPYEIIPNFNYSISASFSPSTGNNNSTLTGTTNTANFTNGVMTGNNFSSLSAGTYELASGKTVDIRPRF